MFLNGFATDRAPSRLCAPDLTEGRAYSAAEYRMWLSEVGLVTGEIVPTLVHCGVLPAAK